MSVKTSMSVLRDFLTSPESSVLALTGAWGVGKTHAWRQALQDNRKSLARPSYCYVSLFGVRTLGDLKNALFLRSVPSHSIGEPLNASNINQNWLELGSVGLKRLASKFGRVLNELPYAKNVSLGIETLAPHFLREMVICLDDFERAQLTPEEILGFISELKEERNCKVALVFNLSKLGEKEAAYRAYKEKVVDHEIRYAPTVDEAIALVFSADYPDRAWVVEHVRDLDIRNIRILRKIRDTLDRVRPAVKSKHDQVRHQCIASSVLLCWCAYEPDESKPKIERIHEWNKPLSTAKAEDEDPATQAWVQRLQSYGFRMVDELDLALARVIERGYVVETGLEEAAEREHALIFSRGQGDEFSAIWARFHGTLTDDADDFVKTLHDVTRRSVSHISSANLNNTVVLLRQLSRDDLADDLIERFIDAHKAEPAAFDLSQYDLGDLISDLRLRHRFEAAHVAHRQLPTLSESLVFMAAFSSYNPDHVVAMRLASVDDYEQVFRTFNGADLRNAIKSSLRFKTGEDAVIGERAREALLRLKALSPLNALRLARFGL